jgi:hypothetical protein
VTEPTDLFAWVEARLVNGSDLGPHAAAYGRHGLEIFPGNPADKTPMVSQRQATTDPEQIAEWWRRWPTALICHRIDTDMVLLDIDPRHGGLDVWHALAAEVGGWPVTRVDFSGRGDGGFHAWWLRPADKLTTTKLDQWARKRGRGHDVGGGRWTAGIDLLQHDHRYSILPISPHPDTAKPYMWGGDGLGAAVAAMPVPAADLITDDLPKPPPRPPHKPDPDSIADWYSANSTWCQLLEPHGWTLRAGDGEADGSRWQHPSATNAFSATIRYGCLFVYSPNTAFDVTAPSKPHGYTRFAAYAVLDHHGDRSAAARAAHEARGDDDGGARLIAAHQRQAQSGSTGGKSKPHRLTLVKASTIGIDRPRWTWDRRISIGGVTLMVGREGMGKTAFACWLSAQITRGLLAGEWLGVGRDVVYVGHEDDRLTVLNPRLTAAGAALDRFHFVDAAGLPFTIATDADELTDKLADHPVSLVIIDPLDSHLGAGIDSHKKAEVQATIEHMARFAQRLRCGVLGLGHLNKAPIRDLLVRVVGSVGFTASVRSVLAIGEHPDNQTDTVCVLAKANMTNRRDVPMVRFHVGQAIDTARIEMVGEEPSIDANALLGIDADSRSKVDAAYDWLDQVLAAGPVGWPDLKAGADARGHSKWALHEARKRYGASLIIEEVKTDKGRATQWRMGGHPVETGPDDPPIPSDQEKRPSAAGVVRSLQRPDDPPKSAPFCRFRAGSTWCVNDPCPNPNHRPQPTTESDEP